MSRAVWQRRELLCNVAEHAESLAARQMLTSEYTGLYLYCPLNCTAQITGKAALIYAL